MTLLYILNKVVQTTGNTLPPTYHILQKLKKKRKSIYVAKYCEYEGVFACQQTVIMQTSI